MKKKTAIILYGVLFVTAYLLVGLLWRGSFCTQWVPGTTQSEIFWDTAYTIYITFAMRNILPATILSALALGVIQYFVNHLKRRNEPKSGPRWWE